MLRLICSWFSFYQILWQQLLVRTIKAVFTERHVSDGSDMHYTSVATFDFILTTARINILVFLLFYTSTKVFRVLESHRSEIDWF